MYDDDTEKLLEYYNSKEAIIDFNGKKYPTSYMPTIMERKRLKECLKDRNISLGLRCNKKEL